MWVLKLGKVAKVFQIFHHLWSTCNMHERAMILQVINWTKNLFKSSKLFFFFFRCDQIWRFLKNLQKDIFLLTFLDVNLHQFTSKKKGFSWVCSMYLCTKPYLPTKTYNINMQGWNSGSNTCHYNRRAKQWGIYH